MKQPPLEWAAISDSVNGFEESGTASKIPNPTYKDNPRIAEAARNLATLYQSLTSGYQCFGIVFEALAAKFKDPQRRWLYKIFREAIRERK